MLEDQGVNVVGVKQKEIYSESKIRKVIRRLFYYKYFTSVLLKTNPQLVYSNTVFNFGDVAIAKLLGKKTIVHVHESAAIFQRLRKKIKLCNPFVDNYIFVSKYNKSCFENYASPKGSVIYNGVHLEQNYPTVVTSADSIPLFGIVGSIDRNKAQLLGLQAVKLLRDDHNLNINLKIIGKVADDGYYQEILDFVRENGLDKQVEIAGQISNREDIYRDLFGVLVTSKDESFGMVAVEAASYNRVVIVSDAGASPEIIIDAETGLVFKSGDFIDLAQKIITVVKDDSLRESLVAAGRQRAEALFDISRNHVEVTSVINNMIRKC